MPISLPVGLILAEANAAADLLAAAVVLLLSGVDMDELSSSVSSSGKVMQDGSYDGQ